jgi:hypothetical protein
MSTSSMQFQLMRAVSTTERERATGWGGMHYAKIEKISSSVIAFLALFMPHSIHETIASSASLELEKIFIAFLIKKKARQHQAGGEFLLDWMLCFSWPQVKMRSELEIL